MQHHHKQHGFGVIEIIVVALLVVIVGVIAWYVWQSQNRSATNGQQVTSQNNQQSSDPYEDWATYCDDLHKTCFRYPSNWTFEPGSGEDWRSARVVSPSGRAAVTYNNPDARDGSAANFRTVALEDIAKADPNFKVLGGFAAPPNSAPGYWILGAPFLVDVPKIGQDGVYASSPRFTNGDGLYASFSATPVGEPLTEAASASWFSSEEAGTCLSILRSLSFQ